MRISKKLILGQFVINLIFIFLGLFISFLLVEVILRIWNPFQFRIKGDRIYLPSNQILDSKNNGIEGLDEIVSHRKNSLGFRGANPPADIGKRLKILTVGGSTTECYYISDGKTWPGLLHKKLIQHFNHLWLNNAGLDGHSTFGHIILMQDQIVKLRPKVVFFLIGANDVGRDDLNRFDSKNLRVSTSQTDGVTEFKRFLLYHSETLSLILNMYRYSMARYKGLTHFAHKQQDIQELERATEIANDRNVVTTLEIQHKKNLMGFKKRLETLILLCLQNQIEPILVTQPTLGRGTELELYNKVTRDLYCQALEPLAKV